jgi:glycosyltransferase involved in cell wall biosynthesis
MKIHSICLCKNEVDVIEECLREATRWSDRIYVYDGASTDGTWERVQAIQNEQIIAWKSDSAVFREGLRAEVFAAFRSDAREGDWWCQLNGDEFYVEDPRAFLQRIPASDHVVWGVNVQFYLTDTDVANGTITGEFAKDRPNLRYYKAACAEPRFFKYRERLVWKDTDAWPEHVGLVHAQPLYFRHYPYRSPQQIQTRLDVRRENRARGFEGWDHAKELEWQEKIVPSSTLHHDAQDGKLLVEEEVLRQHLEPAHRRLVKRVMHGIGVWP